MSRNGTIGESTREIVRQCLRCAEDDDEGKHGAACDQVELVFGKRRQNAPLDADHGTDEGVHDDEQRELREVAPYP
jgi:hypothetical protein